MAKDEVKRKKSVMLGINENKLIQPAEIDTKGMVEDEAFVTAAMSIKRIINADFYFDPKLTDLSSGDHNSFSVIRRNGDKIFTCSKTKGCKLSQPLDEKAMQFIEFMYPKAQSLSVTKCNLDSAIKLIDLYEGKGTKLEFSDEIKAKIEALSDTPEKAKFMEYYNKVAEDRTSQNRTKFGR